MHSRFRNAPAKSTRSAGIVVDEVREGDPRLAQFERPAQNSRAASPHRRAASRRGGGRHSPDSSGSPTVSTMKTKSGAPSA